MLWNKNSNEDDPDGYRQAKPPDIGSKNRRHSANAKLSSPTPILRVPDTVVFLFGQPHQWYFTSKNGGPDKNKTTILRKRRGNLTLANIEEVFLNKTASRGEVGDDDVVAYFISSKIDGKEADQHASLDACSAVVDNEISCNIEYFNKNTFHEFLQHGRNNKSGILQRFIAPHGGGRHNSLIRAIWTPKLCILERRRTKQDLHDTRFALYERCITFDGPDVHSVSVPLRGTVLAGRVENICNEIVRHIAGVSAESVQGSSDMSSRKGASSFPGVARMVVNFKVDGNGKIWILWSNSIRIQSVAADSKTKLTESDSHSSMHSIPSQPLNMETVVCLPTSTKLTQAPSHNANVKLDNKLSSATCPSCNKHDPNPHFQPVPYKTIIQHFEKTLEMLEERDESHPSRVWPPEARFTKAAGDVGFGSLPLQLARDREANPSKKYSEETHTIPPVIRHIHPKLRTKGYNMYRHDPLFLLKTSPLCETCFLSYAEFITTSFTHMVRPIEPYESEKVVPYEFPDDATRQNRPRDGGTKNASTPQQTFCNVGSVPELPPAIMTPPKTANSSSSIPLKPKDTLFNTLPTYFPSTDMSKKNLHLGHMVDSFSRKAAQNDAKESALSRVETLQNPYGENLERLID